MTLTCVACGNCLSSTKHIRPEVIYHPFPINSYSRRKWLKVYRLYDAYKWQSVCSDHFLKEHYIQGNKRFLCSKAIPRPFERSSNGNGFLYNSTTQSNGMQVDNNTFLPIEQNCLREEQHVENAVEKTERFERQIPADQFIAYDNIQAVINCVEEPDISTTKDLEGNCPIPRLNATTKGYIKEDRFIFKVSRMLKFPSFFWGSDYSKERNETTFYQRDHTETFITKKVYFSNSLMPVIIIYDKEYKFNVPIVTKYELHILLEIINKIDTGLDEKCKGYFEDIYIELRNQFRRSNVLPTQREIISIIYFQNLPELLIL